MNDEPRLRVTAYAVAVNDASILLTQLNEASPVFAPGAWNLPGGGLDPGEQPRDALTRELREEAGLEIAEATLVDGRSYLAERNGIQWNVVALLYRATLMAGEATVTEEGGSASGVRWFPLDRIGELTLTPPAVEGLRLIEAVPA
ncbi:NUDIX hydrolase [Rhizomonospora bruguierae]|uniref:NUDIX hydrolase n=1 Tax=Rhizomonospora bruguierae TaxID=1581705 RepID=UPI001BCDDFAF|nr:NUDIX domain-containing protein [Micromonospora sp. NBRC 107566]